jgi:hypothetical protein
MSEEKEEDIKVTEEKDGSVIVDLPANLVQDEPEDKEPVAREAAPDDDGDDDQPGDTEAIREARRARRRAKKELSKRTREEKDQRLIMLQRKNEELTQQLSSLERRLNNSDLAKFDQAINDEEMRLNFAMRKIKEATDNSDGEAMKQAQQLWYETRRKLDMMKATKEKAAERLNSQPETVNPRIERHANEWMERNSWYHKEGKDEDSQIAKIIDAKLADEGFDPATEEYWEELDERLQKRLPHRYTDYQDEQPQRRRPKSVVTGSSQESSGPRSSGGTFVITPEQKRAMQDAGFWDDPVLRNKMIKRYALEARNNRG